VQGYVFENIHHNLSSQEPWGQIDVTSGNIEICHPSTFPTLEHVSAGFAHRIALQLPV